ncbi:MAG: 1-deoxy-D-xylulose-5-phosphate synthase [Deltaproteobacteria bacterium]|nr:1-deoxy-D-xylulose-5-phosphate synthase [Deltaproteobacteria bacterium]
MKILDRINYPNDLKKLTKSELEILAKEIREYIVKVISKNGGHLASSLGVVELTIALHYVFDTPSDKIIWDVGHQSYAHKILTGRKKEFQNIRKFGGISGFTRISESIYDSFTTGHSSTSISAGLGIISAKRLKHDNSKVISVIGDGSMTAGVAFEGMNQTGDLHKDLIVILNDNEMSISPNVGALSSLLSRTFSIKSIQNLKRNFGDFLKSLPKIGDNAYQFVKKVEDSFKTFITPGMLFEAFNFDYFGPIDGHNLNRLITILNNIKINREPVLLHVITKKGKGYAPAEKNPVYFHGVGSFELETGKTFKKENAPPSYTQVFGSTMIKLAEKNDKIIAITAAMPEGTGLTEFAKLFPKRFFDVGIAEQHGALFAAAIAAEGFKPVVAIYSTFLQRAYDQILHDVCIESLPVIFAIDRSGIVGEDGPTHHGLFDLSYLRSLPNMVLMSPKNENELANMLEAATLYKCPIAVRYPRGAGTGAPVKKEDIPIGKAEILSSGEDITLLAVGQPVSEAVIAAEELKKFNISASVINARFIKPLDTELIISTVKKNPNIITVEDNILAGGFGSAVIEALSDQNINFKIKRLGIKDQFVEHGSQKELRAKYGIDSAAIVEAAKKLLKPVL